MFLQIARCWKELALILMEFSFLRLFSSAGSSHSCGTALLVEILKRTPKKYQEPVLWAWLEVVFTPKRHQFKTNLISPVIHFWVQYAKRYSKVSAVDLLRLSTLRGIRTAFLNHKRYDEHPVFFILESPFGDFLS